MTITEDETRAALIAVVKSTGEALAAAVTAATEAGIGPAVLMPTLIEVFEPLLPPGVGAMIPSMLPS